ncbi:TetR/AcrR family transcriptional regulator [Tundrisphaera sp. TA3]|uniref:TetR/AcrR family transcriptional regulator n=1 Tax=Tundrisphaera sp. TA3 TaxID=3435775 RepID=UPI003EB6E195
MADPNIPPDDATPDGDARTRILVAASRLISEGGREAATTRAVATAARVQLPTIYRLFGDKQGLLEAVAEHDLAAYVAAKARLAPNTDPIEDLREGWDAHIAFSLANPGLFAILAGDPQSKEASPAARAGREVLRRRMRRLANAGLLKTSEERATDLWHAAGVGIVFTLLSQPESARDPDLSTFARETVLAEIADVAATRAERRPQVAAAELRASLDAIGGLSDGERLLLAEWLDRIARSK